MNFYEFLWIFMNFMNYYELLWIIMNYYELLWIHDYWTDTRTYLNLSLANEDLWSNLFYTLFKVGSKFGGDHRSASRTPPTVSPSVFSSSPSPSRSLRFTAMPRRRTENEPNLGEICPKIVNQKSPKIVGIIRHTEAVLMIY